MWQCYGSVRDPKYWCNVHLFESPSLPFFSSGGKTLEQSLHLRQILCLNHDLQTSLPSYTGMSIILYKFTRPDPIGLPHLINAPSSIFLPGIQTHACPPDQEQGTLTKGLVSRIRIRSRQASLYSSFQYFADTAHGFWFEEVSPDMAPVKLVTCQATSV